MDRVDHRHDAPRRHHLLGRPAVAVADVHVLDEAHHDVGPAESLHQLQQSVVVDPPLHHDVELDRPQAGRHGGVQAAQHRFQRLIQAVHVLEHVRVERIQADRHPIQPGVGQRPRVPFEQKAVGGQRDVVDAARTQRRQRRDQPCQIAAQERFAAGDAQLADAQVREQPGQPDRLVVGELIGGGHEAVVGAELFLRHAVRAAEVAAVGDRHAQVVQRTPEAVGAKFTRHGHPSDTAAPRVRQRSGPAPRQAPRSRPMP